MQSFPSAHLLTLSGAPRQRGQAHGEALRSQIHAVLERWNARLAGLIDSAPGPYIHDLVTTTAFIAAVERWTPGLLDEVRGIAEGAGVDFETLFGFQLLDEEWWFAQDRRNKLHAENRNCSSIGWAGADGAPSLVAQNMDLPDFLDGFQVVLRIQDPGADLDALVFSVAGLVALNGLNNRGVGVVCNNLGMLNHSTAGLPVAFVHRGVLQQDTFDKAQAFLQTVPHASGQNYLLGGRHQIVDLECSANQVAIYTQPGRLRSVCHTNHPFVNDDYLQGRPTAAQPGERITPLLDIYDEDSHLRFEAISQASEGAGAGSGAAGIQAAQNILSSHTSPTNPVCRHPQPAQPWMTIGTSIIVLSDHPHLVVSPGPPCTAEFAAFEF